MKKKSFNSKLLLNKEIVSNLQKIKGGSTETRPINCLEPSYNSNCNDCGPLNSNEPGIVCMPTVGAFCDPGQDTLNYC